MSDRIKELLNRLDALPKPTGLVDEASIEILLAHADLLDEVPNLDCDIEQKRKVLRKSREQISDVIEQFGASNRHVKLVRAIETVVEAAIEGKPEPTDQDLGLTKKWWQFWK